MRPKLQLKNDDTIDVWIASVSVNRQPLDILSETLNKDEQSKIKRFLNDKDKQRYALSHSMKRIVLSKYLHANPKEIKFRTTKHKKPFLKDSKTNNGESLFFNLSHSEDLIVLAIFRGQEIGVDIEYVKKIHRLKELSERCFSQQEQEFIFEEGSVESTKRFYQAWVGKESYLKAIGTGLTDSMHTISILEQSPQSGEWLTFTPTTKIPDSTMSDAYQIMWIPVDSNYQTAICIPRSMKEVSVKVYDFLRECELS